MAYGVQKVAKRIQFIVSQALIRELHDPKLGFITITKVEVSQDFRKAVVFFSLLEKGKRGSCLAALRRAKGYLQKLVAKGVRTRRVPRLEFEEDTSLEKSLALSKIFEQIASEQSPPPNPEEDSPSD